MESKNSSLLSIIVNGFFGGLAALGVASINPRPAEFEAAFSRAWAEWLPASSGELTRLRGGRYGYKAVLYRARGPESLFRHYQTAIEPLPKGLNVDQFLHIWAGYATPDQWRDLAQLYLRHASKWNHQAVQQPSPTKTDQQSPQAAVIRVPVIRRNGIRVPGGIIRRASGSPSTAL